MSVVVVGGNDRMATRYKEICKQFNCKAKVFTQMPADFENKLGTPDLMVVFTNTCSHKMVISVNQKSVLSFLFVKSEIHSLASSNNESLKKYPFDA